MRCLLLVLALAGCGGRQRWAGDPLLYGVDLVVTDDAAPCAHAPDAASRLRHILDLTSRYFGFDPADIAGLRIVLQADRTALCPAAPGERLLGCYDALANTITVSTTGLGCLESSYITHELLHFFIGDPGHTDPRWATFVPLWQMLQAGVNCNQD